MNSIKAQIRKLFEYYQDRKAWFKSLFDIVPVSRKYDNWYYWDGNLMSKYDVFIDGEWTLAEFDAKFASLAVINENKWTLGEHQIRIVVTDERDNEKAYASKFMY